MGTVVVTGANGMLGKTVCDKFKSQGVEVIEVTRQKVDLMLSLIHISEPTRPY